jgi:hypothetical protein
MIKRISIAAIAIAIAAVGLLPSFAFAGDGKDVGREYAEKSCERAERACRDHDNRGGEKAAKECKEAHDRCIEAQKAAK